MKLQKSILNEHNIILKIFNMTKFHILLKFEDFVAILTNHKTAYSDQSEDHYSSFLFFFTFMQLLLSLLPVKK